MGRYSNKKIKAPRVGIDGKIIPRTESLPLYPNMRDSDDFSYNDLWIISTDGDRLDLLSHRFYGDVKYWYIIAAANGMGKGTYYVKPGTRMRIPAFPQGIEKDIKG